MLKKILSVAVVGALAYSAFVFASGDNSVAPKVSANFDEAKLKATLSAKIGVTVSKVTETPFPNVVLLMTERGTFYSTKDGGFFIQGNVYDIRGNGAVDLAQASMAEARLEGVERFKDDMIVYPAKDEKYVVSIFTDITCGYCRKLHSEMDDYNKLGITVKYLAYPRAGVYDQSGSFSKGFQDLRSIWCHEDPVEAMTKAKGGAAVVQRICDKPIKEEFEFGQQIGVSGTPAIILENGDLLPGYKPAADLEKILKAI